MNELFDVKALNAFLWDILFFFSFFSLSLKVCDSVLLRDQIWQGMNTQIQRTLNEMIQRLFEVGNLISIRREELLLLQTKQPAPFSPSLDS